MVRSENQYYLMQSKYYQGILDITDGISIQVYITDIRNGEIVSSVADKREIIGYCKLDGREYIPIMSNELFMFDESLRYNNKFEKETVMLGMSTIGISSCNFKKGYISLYNDNNEKQLVLISEYLFKLIGTDSRFYLMSHKYVELYFKKFGSNKTVVLSLHRTK